MNKIKKSLVLQTSFLFFISFLVIILLWIFFYFQQKYQHQEYDISRYFNTASSLQPLLYKDQQINNEDLKVFAMKISNVKYSSYYDVILKKGDKNKGFIVISYKSKRLIYIYNKQKDIMIEDISTHKSMVIIHLVFILLLITQGLLYIKLQKSLSPLTSLHKKLKKLKIGDLSPLKIDSHYEEIKQMIKSYNDSISKIEYMLELREMFNKIFMHEMKMPLAKGMFYLKQEPSNDTHAKLNNILHGLNKELDDFFQIETLISNQNKIIKETHNIKDLLILAKKRAHIEENHVVLKNIEDKTIEGDKEFLVLCFKNLLDNAIKYSFDNKVIVDGNHGVTFENKADELPVDISQDIKKWKIDKNKRHKSSTGYGFGLFIIKNIISIHNMKLIYTYDNNKKIVRLQIK
ncbi:hypothetical protein CRV02_01320 [Arcobacter sp. CECT 8989]|uniref:ATP-binding protein n=1 Tax=Arcobacter sp. CECT 8989 TaxID=2044509 RepID=UPI00100A67F3|nr:ATP-binding protein [Arcobacter sp. CECT 8989]RXK03860.1 hypothetical protein CRV02_01320 [Arcobacter sp. CECT 8989]